MYTVPEIQGKKLTFSVSFTFTFAPKYNSTQVKIPEK